MEPQKSNGALVGSVIIVVILIIGGIYLWRTSMTEEPIQNQTIEQEGEVTDESAAELEAELNSMDLESLDEGI